MTSSSRSLPFIVVLALALSGCTGPSEPTPPPSPSPSTTAEATPTPTPTLVDCPDILSADGNAKLAADGLEPRDPRVVDPFAVRLVDAGGVACTWVKAQTDLVLTVVQLPVPDSEWNAWETALLEADFVDSTGSGTLFTGPIEVGSGVSPVVVASGDRITFLNTPAFADLLAPHTI
ncbi:hypothetical protein [Agromyces sp. NPDC049794]|uniref:hypothetical protein n=1 Tax=unclassified Agromyces TaxID=2639701 RepID=UPI0033CFD788